VLSHSAKNHSELSKSGCVIRCLGEGELQSRLKPRRKKQSCRNTSSQSTTLTSYDPSTEDKSMMQDIHARLIAAIARVTRDVGVAEELAQDALVTALERWPDEGIPTNSGAWLMTAAKRQRRTHASRNCSRRG
jgi:hypothetical protein